MLIRHLWETRRGPGLPAPFLKKAYVTWASKLRNGFIWFQSLSKALDILRTVPTGEGLAFSGKHLSADEDLPDHCLPDPKDDYVHRGYLAQTQDGHYRLVSRPKKIRFGFAAQSAELPFSEAVTESLKMAAQAAGIDLLVLVNHATTRSSTTKCRHAGETACRSGESNFNQRCLRWWHLSSCRQDCRL